MNCPECQELIQRRLDGEFLPPDQPLGPHLAQCPACRDFFAAAQRLLEALKAVPRPAPADDLKARITARVLRDRQRRRDRMRRSLYVTAALAASILIMLLAGYFWKPAADPQDPGHVVQTNPNPVDPPPAPRDKEAKP